MEERGLIIVLMTSYSLFFPKTSKGNDDGLLAGYDHFRRVNTLINGPMGIERRLLLPGTALLSRVPDMPRPPS